MRQVLLALALFGLGCSGDDPDASSSESGEPPPTGTGTGTDTGQTGTGPSTDAKLELGAGLTTWAPLEDGDPIELVAGIQGGWHVDVGVRAEGLEPDGLLLRYHAEHADTSSVVSFTTEALLSDKNVLPEEGGWVRPGDRIVFDIESPEAVVGSMVCLQLSAVSSGWEGQDRRCVLVIDELP